MSQLIIVVLSIALAALLVAGGTNYMNPDMGLRAQATERIVADYRLIEGAIASYRIANRGARPSPAPVGTPLNKQAWRREIQEYLPDRNIPVIKDHQWSYFEDNGRKLCLYADNVPEQAMSDAMVTAQKKIGIETVDFAVDCLDQDPRGKSRSLIFKLK